MCRTLSPRLGWPEISTAFGSAFHHFLFRLLLDKRAGFRLHPSDSRISPMLLYAYRGGYDAPLDFSVRRVDGPMDQDWPFEFCDVTKDGISYSAGVREGDRVNGHCDFKQSGQKNPRNWKDDTLSKLNQKSEGTLLILFVDKRVGLVGEHATHMKKRLEFISSRKSNLKKLNRLDELPMILRKWDLKKLSLKGSAAHERGGNEVPRDNDWISPGEAEQDETTGEMTPSTLSNEAEAGIAVVYTRDSTDSDEPEYGGQRGDDFESFRDDSSHARDAQVSSDPRQQNSDAVITFAERSGDILLLADMTENRQATPMLSAQGDCAEVQEPPIEQKETVSRQLSSVMTASNVDGDVRVSGSRSLSKLPPYNADPEGLSARSLNGQSDRDWGAESENLEDNGQNPEEQTCGDARTPTTYSNDASYNAGCGEDQRGQITAFSGIKRRYSRQENQSCSTTKRAKTANCQAIPTHEVPHLDVTDANSCSEHAPQQPAASEAVLSDTNEWDAEAAAAVAAKQLLVKMAQRSDLVQVIASPQWQAWLRGLLSRRFEGEIITELEKAILSLSAGSSKDECTGGQFGEYVSWVANQLSADKPVLPVKLGDANLESLVQPRLSVPIGIQDPLEITKACKTFIDRVATTRLTLLEEQQQYLQASEAQSLESTTKTIQLQDKRTELDSRLFVLGKAREACRLAAEQAKATATRLDMDLMNATSTYMTDSLLQNCATAQETAKHDRWNAHVLSVSSDPKILLLQESLVHVESDAKAKERIAMAATYLLAFWKSVLELLSLAQCQHEEYVKRQEASTNYYKKFMLKKLQSLDTTLFSALEQYFSTSFRVQEDALSSLKPLLQERTEMDTKFGGFLGAASTEIGITQFQGVLAVSKRKDLELVELLYGLQEVNSECYRKLDGQLAKAHASLWGEFLEVLNEVKINRQGEGIQNSDEERERRSCGVDEASVDKAHLVKGDRFVSEVSLAEIAPDSPTPGSLPVDNEDFNCTDEENKNAFVDQEPLLTSSTRSNENTQWCSMM